jgi:transcription-repair coupling factor (superfamily II helicase)
VKAATSSQPAAPEDSARTITLSHFVEGLREHVRQRSGAAAATQLTGRYFHLGGVRGAGAPLLASSVARGLSRPVLYVTPDAESAEAAARDLRYLIAEPRLWTGAAGLPGRAEGATEKEGASEAADAPRLGGAAPQAHTVRLLLPSETSPYEQVHPDRRAMMRRSSTLAALATQQPFSFLVTSAAGLLRRLAPPAPLRAASLELGLDMNIDLRDVAARLTAAGYLRNPVVEDPGCVAVRGGLLDVWPPDESSPIRIELAGDNIASLRRFDPDTQRTRESVERVWLPPATDLLVSAEVKERAVSQLRALCDAANFPSGKTRRLLEDLIDGHSLFGAEGYLPALYPLVTLWDYLPEHLTVIERPADVVAAIESALESAARSHERQTEVPRFALEALFVDQAELAARLEATEVVLAHQTSVASAERPAGLAALELCPLDTPSLAFEDQSELERAMSQRGQGGHQTLAPLVRALAGWGELGLGVIFTARTETQARRLSSLLADRHVAVGESSGPGQVAVHIGGLTRGLVAESLGLVFVTEEEVFGHRAHRASPRKQSARAALEDLRALAPGDFVVHVEHGIGRYLGLENKRVGTGASVDLLVVEYRGGDKLFVPVYRMNQIQKLSGGDADTKLDRLGGQTFAKTKAKVKRKVREMADELLGLYAQRAATERVSMPPIDAEYLAFEAAFPFEETADQAGAIADIMADLERPKVMDRLVCGDVGFGKTEVALRAAFRHVMAGHQVALLCPTTLLANQHYQSVQRRFADYPVKVDMLSRFRSKKAQLETAMALRSGSVDIVIGTHRLISKDVHFKRLGLLIVDEEQRFGVAAKERIKQLKKDVDVLTLSATPIPRTLQMAIGGLSDLSIIATPPLDRRAVRTTTARYDDTLVASVIERELDRGGQVYYVYNRIEGIAERAARIQALVPRARVTIGHGQLSESLLERSMLGFVQGDYNVLVATAIVESGLDIPRANTLIVDRADLFGLAQLYQLRGRVGRSSERAYCYLLVPAPSELSDEARMRVDALTRYTELGSGLQIAELDMELRGSGNFLGAEQSGAVQSVGFDLFCQMLAEATQELRGEEVEHEVDPEISVDIEALLPEDYVPEVGVRLSLYKRLAGASDESRVTELAIEIEDRFGSLPRSAQNLVELMSLKAQLRQLKVLSCEASARAVTLHLREDTPLDTKQITRLALERPDVYRVTPHGQVVRRSTERERSAGGLELARRMLREIAQG